MHSVQTPRRATRVAAACVALLALCLWPVLDIDARPAHHAAGRTAPHRGARSGVSRSDLAAAGHAGDDVLAAAPAEAGTPELVGASHASSYAIVTATAFAAVPRLVACEIFDLVCPAVSMQPGCTVPGRAPPVA